MNLKYFVLLSIFIVAAVRPLQGQRLTEKLRDAVSYASSQYSRVLLDDPPSRNQYPHMGSPNAQNWDINTESGSWTAGFYPGVLWQLFKLTSDSKWSTAAVAAQEGVRWRQTDTSTHDIGFVIMSSFGLGYEMGFGHGNDQDDWESIIVQTARTLITRFVAPAGVIRSWNNADWNTGKPGECLVIIDNMMNLALLYRAQQLSGEQVFGNIANTHATTTMNNHFRPPDSSTFHVVAYDDTVGGVVRKFQFQGYIDNSTWSRGQAWSILGFAESYLSTGNPEFLATSEKAAAYFLENLPEDYVPYWDFDAGKLAGSSYQPRDTSAAAIAALGLLNLYKINGNSNYLNRSEVIIESVLDNYNAKQVNIPAISINGTVHNKNKSFDTAIIYGDFYLLKYAELYFSLNK